MSSYESSSLGLWGGEGEDIIKRDFPIHRACRDGDLKLLREAWAVASYEQLTTEDKFYGWTPIHWAAYFGQIDCVHALLAFGISVNLCTVRFKQTPCHIASFGGHPSCLLELLRGGANFHAHDYLGETPMHKAARVGNAECIRVLLENGSRVNLCNNNGHTPCDLARMQSFHECVRLLETVGAQQMADANYCSNGSSGAAVGTINGHMVGNGHFNNDMNGNSRQNKRMYDDESIPNFKKRRPGLALSHSVIEYANGHDDTMDMDDGVTPCNGHRSENGIHLSNGYHNGNMEYGTQSFNGHPNGDHGSADATRTEQYIRAPSPGMDLKLHEDMQLWCHQNGYGDTAEMMPSASGSHCLKHRQPFRGETGYDRSVCANYRGLQARGWH